MQRSAWRILVGAVAVLCIVALSVPSGDARKRKRKPPRIVPFSVSEGTAGGIINLIDVPSGQSLIIDEVSVSSTAGTPGTASVRLAVWTANVSFCPPDWSGISVTEQSLRSVALTTYSTEQVVFPRGITIAGPPAGQLSCLIADPVVPATGFVEAGATGARVIPR